MLSFSLLSNSLPRPRLGQKPAGRRVIRLAALFTACLLLSVVTLGDLEVTGRQFKEQLDSSLAIVERINSDQADEVSDQSITADQQDQDDTVNATATNQHSTTGYQVQLVSYNKIEQLRLEQKLDEQERRKQEIIQTTATLASSEISDADSPYIRNIERRIERSGNRLWLESRRRLQGAAEIQFEVFHDGRLGEMQILTSSGNQLLDQQLLTSIRQASPFPPVPLALQQSGQEAIRLIRTLSFVIQNGP